MSEARFEGETAFWVEMMMGSASLRMDNGCSDCCNLIFANTLAFSDIAMLNHQVRLCL